MERVLVTGAAGYLGSVLVPHLLNNGYAVTAFDRFRRGNHGLASCIAYEGFTPFRGDCRDATALREALKNADWIIPLAAVVGAPACDADVYEASTTNLHAINLLLSLRGKGQRVLFPNTNSGYGSTVPGTSCDEDSPFNPVSLYGVTKARAEQSMLKHEGTTAFRLATAFGPSPRMRLDLLVNDFTWRAVRDRAVVLYQPKFRRNYMHVHDIGRLFVFGMRNFDALKGKPWNAGLHYCMTKRELCEEIRKAVPEFQFVEAPAGEDPDKRDYDVSVARLKAAGFECSVSLSRGIRELRKAFLMLPPGEFSNV